MFSFQQNSPETEGIEIKPGEIRRLIDMELHNDSRLVAVVNYNSVDESALVVLVNNLTEIATPRDVLLTTEMTSAQFELSLLPDFVARVWKQQLNTSPVFGMLDPALIDVWLEENKSPGLMPKSSDKPDPKFSRGSYLPEFGDHVWLFRGKEIDALNSLGHSFNFYESFSRFNEIWRQEGSQINITDLIANNDFSFADVDILFSTDAYRYELV
jgi:hypothetical protein